MKRGGEKIVGSGAEKLSKKVSVRSSGTNGQKNLPGDDPNQDRFMSTESSGNTAKRPFGSQSSNSSNIKKSNSTQNVLIYGKLGNLDTLNDDEDFQDENLVIRKRRNQLKAKIKKDEKEETAIEILSSETNSVNPSINEAAVQEASEVRIKNGRGSQMSQKELNEISTLKGQLTKKKTENQILQRKLNSEQELSKKLQLDLVVEQQSNFGLRNELDDKNSVITSMLSALQEFGKTQILILSQQKGISHPSIATGQKDMGGLVTETVSTAQNSSAEKLLHDTSILTPPFKQEEEALNEYQQNQKSDETSIVVHDISDNKEEIHDVLIELTSTNTKTATEEIVEGSRDIPLTLDTPITRAYRKLEACNRLITSNLSKHIGSKNNTLAQQCKLDHEGKKFRCTSCSIQFSNLIIAIKHEVIACRIHHSSDVLDQLGIRIQSCDECGKEFLSAAHLITHELTHVPISRNSACPGNCGSYFQTQLHANQHYKNGSCPMNRINKQSICGICREIFVSRGKLAEHVAMGHIPTNVQVYAWVDGNIIRRDQIETDRVHSKKGGIWILFGMPIFHAKHGYLLCIGRSSHWDVAVTAFRNVKKCIKALEKLNKSLILCNGCSLRKWLKEGWVALPDLAFRIGGMFVVGSMLGSKIKWFEREKNGDAYVLSPDDLNELIEDAIGPLLKAEVDKVRHLFEPTDDVRASTRHIGKDYVFKGIKHILKRKVIDGPFQGPNSKKYLGYLEDQTKQLICDPH